MATKKIELNGVSTDLGADAQNIDYTNNGMTGVTNAKGALDNLNGRVHDIENPPEQIAAEYTEAAATISGKYVYTNGSEVTDGNYKCSPYIQIPVGVRMFVKTDYAFTGYLNLQISKYTDQSLPLLTVKSGGPYAEWTEVLMPDNAKYFRFNLTNDTTKHISIKFVSIPSIDSPVKLKVASWNVEGWNEPRNSMTIDEMRKAFREKFDSVNADIICMSEYGKWFDGNNAQTLLAENEILGNYPFKKIGNAHNSYNHNVVVSKIQIVAVREFDFSTLTNGQGRYWKEATIRINGKEIKVVAAHFDFQDKTYQTEYQQSQHYENQFKQIVQYYANDPYVIIGADFNVHRFDKNGVHKYISPGESDPDEVYISSPGDENYGYDGYLNYQYFVDAGYTLLNFDYLTMKSPRDVADQAEVGEHTADNIAVKGFAMGAREYVSGTYGLSDHPMVSCELVML